MAPTKGGGCRDFLWSQILVSKGHCPVEAIYLTKPKQASSQNLLFGGGSGWREGRKERRMDE
jgi:hypothetical protein